MLCRHQASSIYPISQSVFATDHASRFWILCEPLTEKEGMNSHSLMRIPVVADSQGVSDGVHKRCQLSPAPRLVAP